VLLKQLMLGLWKEYERRKRARIKGKRAITGKQEY
jgi:hypothetical protein